MHVLTLVFDQVPVGLGTRLIIKAVYIPKLNADLTLVIRLVFLPKVAYLTCIDKLPGLRTSRPKKHAWLTSGNSSDPCIVEVAKCSDNEVVLSLQRDSG